MIYLVLLLNSFPFASLSSIRRNFFRVLGKEIHKYTVFHEYSLELLCVYFWIKVVVWTQLFSCTSKNLSSLDKQHLQLCANIIKFYQQTRILLKYI